MKTAAPPRYVRNAIRTPDGTILRSQSVHDYRTHLDANGKEYMVDGGMEYLRRNVHPDAPYEELSVESSQPFEVIREALEWGTYGKDGKSPLRYVALSEMSDDHINKVIEHLQMQVQRVEEKRAELMKEMSPSLELRNQLREAVGLSSKRSELPEATEPWVMQFMRKELEHRKQNGISIKDPE